MTTKNLDKFLWALAPKPFEIQLRASDRTIFQTILNQNNIMAKSKKFISVAKSHHFLFYHQCTKYGKFTHFSSTSNACSVWDTAIETVIEWFFRQFRTRITLFQTSNFNFLITGSSVTNPPKRILQLFWELVILRVSRIINDVGNQLPNELKSSNLAVMLVI